MKPFILTLIILQSSLYSTAQSHIYKLDGSLSESISGKVFLIPAIKDAKYYDKNGSFDSAIIKDGKFNMVRKVYTPGIYPYVLFFRNKKISGATNMVFLSAKDQVVSIDSIDAYQSPTVTGSSVQRQMQDYFKYFAGFLAGAKETEMHGMELNKKYHGNLPAKEEATLTSKYEALGKESDSLFFEYAKSNPNSYVTLWKLIERFKNKGYNKLYSGIYNLLSQKIKDTRAAGYLSDDLKTAEATAIGSIFPDLQLQTKDFKSVSVSNLNPKAQFTLVDFWFSACKPCLVQFPEFKNIYSNYQYAGLGIMGVSVDTKADSKKWIQTISEKKLLWPNYLDEGGNLSKSLAINYFPTNFLLNSKGVIIKKNITPDELNKFLHLNLKIANNIQNEYEPQ